MPADRATSTKVTGSEENERRWRGPVTSASPIEPMYFRQSRLDNVIGVFVPDDCLLPCLGKNTSMIAEKNGYGSNSGHLREEQEAQLRLAGEFG